MAVVIIDPQRQICVSETVVLEAETLTNADLVVPELIASAQAAAARMAGGYRARRKAAPTRSRARSYGALRVISGGKG